MNHMAGVQSERDAEFFTAIWESLHAEAGSRDTEHERRRAARFPYQTLQLLAPVHGDTVPTIEQFKTVMCRDISSGGFSYRSDQKPESDRIVVLLRTKDEKRCIEARVVHSRPTFRDGRLQFDVGCKFTRRIPFS
jgi:hypothetical protein